jgi:hypothetical protein
MKQRHDPAMSVLVTGTLRVSRIPLNRLFTDTELASAGTTVFEEKNLLVNIGLQVFSRMLGGNVGAPTIDGLTFGSISDLVVSKMRLGRTPTPQTPAPDHTFGVETVVYEPLLIVSYPTPYSVRFTGILPTTEANGDTITEEALYLKKNGGDGNPLVFAKRLISPGIVKTSSAALQFDHEFTFARS